MRILGIDPGLTTMGYGLIELEQDKEFYLSCGVIKTAPELPVGEALTILRGQLKALLAQYQPDLAGVEKLYVVKNLKTAMKVGEARGVIMQLLQESGVPAEEYIPTEIKQAVTGYGQATKQQIQAMVKRILRLDFLPKPADAADALAIALTASRLSKFKRLTGQAQAGMLKES
ncbi:MAG: crossover junction endodeoxyribonuclease RuvC [Candidatus Abawacabacteria bacterium RIFCSPHIGHO2_01_FULL_46_8]|uniref:Crossover junction endodeoxyribonuclease RuvC n=1 Tax=Candidatus Abawacabacteria bacterium RIFCSPHIGHO2_01_FULL_46_8 TaxID=1817815 RepID=A0A1F4XLE2_9BACT|nr:MAG: crossover junction endodeoxyribonuclease RuvC [Candidatus Abawacabacteria bacterium RIFCSPHIGHO2_01_FULL_46_8]